MNQNESSQSNDDGGPQMAPEIVQKPNNIFSYEGDDLTFQTKVSGNPIPKIYWFKNGQPLKPTQRCHIEYKDGVAYLHIHMLLPEDAACYTLLTENNFGLAIYSIKLNINYVNDENVNINQRQEYRRPRAVQPTQHNRDDLITSTGIKPNFYIIPNDIDTLEGQIVRFECRVSGRPEPEVLWYKNDSRIYDCEHYKCVVNEEGNYALLIMGADGTDTATYKCVATNSTGQASFTVCLNVIEREHTIAPKFVERFQHMNARENESIVLHCRAVGMPTPQLGWQKDGIQIESNPPNHEIKSQDGKSSLFLNNLSVRDAGWYQCTAQNQAGSVATRARVNVESSFQPPIGEPVQIRLPKTHRIIESQTIEPYETVTLRHVQKVYHHYSSTEYDSASSMGLEQQQQQQQMQRRPAFSTHLRDVQLMQGDRAHFEAHLSVFDYTDLIIEWYLNGKLLESSDGSDGRVITTNRYGYIALTLMNVLPTDSGIITCKVRNQYGEAITSATLKCIEPQHQGGAHASLPPPPPISEYTDRYENVEDSEFFKYQREIEESRKKIAPNFVRPLASNIQVQSGCRVVLEAQLTPVNDPTLRIEWLINGQPLSGNNRMSTTFDFGYVSLAIIDVQQSDSGLYVVKATNAGGEAASTCSLKIIPGLFVISNN